MNPICYVGIDPMPQFLGGDDSMKKFIQDNKLYPLIAIEKKIEGTVYARFAIEPDGSITHVKIIKGIGGGCDE